MAESARQDFRMVHRLRVRWGEVDIQRIVFNPHYLTYVDSAFTDYWRALAIPYESIPGLLGGDLYVKKSTLEYHGSAQLDDLLDICLKCERIGNTSLLFRGGIFQGDALLVSAEMVYVFADPTTQRPTPVPPLLRGLIDSYEAGESPIELRIGSWAELGSQANALRKEVFRDEFRISNDFGHDAADPASVHALILNQLGNAIGTGRLVQESTEVARIGRVAVSRALRSSGFGRTLMLSLMQVARQKGCTEVVLSVQRSAEAFYKRLGFEVTGAPFVEAGISHVHMRRPLDRAPVTSDIVE